MTNRAKSASELTDTDLKTLIQNHERAAQTQVARYRELVEEHARRFGHGLRVDVSLACLMEASRTHRFTTYGDLAEANRVPWSQARRLMSGARGHLDNLLSVCHARGLPLLTALCVNKEATSDGQMVDEALRGFVKGAQRLGYKVTDERAFPARVPAAVLLLGRTGIATRCLSSRGVGPRRRAFVSATGTEKAYVPAPAVSLSRTPTPPLLPSPSSLARHKPHGLSLHSLRASDPSTPSATSVHWYAGNLGADARSSRGRRSPGEVAGTRGQGFQEVSGGEGDSENPSRRPCA